MDINILLEFLISEAEHPFSGWDFSYINDRIANTPLTWSYFSKVLPFVRISESLLDMGTGGGEFLASLAPLPKLACATEGYEPNVEIARKKLELLGVKVVFLDDNQNLPFKNDMFEVIINRHEYYNPKEVYRILNQDGIFVTQQIGDRNDRKLKDLLNIDTISENESERNLEYAINELEAVGFEILERKEDITCTRIYDVGALVYYLKAIPWDFPDFSVEKYYKRLVEINEIIKKKGYLDLKLNNHRFLIIVKKS